MSVRAMSSSQTRTQEYMDRFAMTTGPPKRYLLIELKFCPDQYMIRFTAEIMLDELNQ